MPEKDHYEKKLEDFDDVFVDIINVLLFDGREIVHESELKSGMVRSSYNVDGKFEEQERDSKKYWMNGQIRIAMFGLENQTEEESDFPVRVIAYDGAEYRDQLRLRNDVRRENAKIRKEAKKKGIESKLLSVPELYPVVTLVLYFGETKWKGSLSLKDHLRIPIELEEFVPDYKINLREISFLDEKTVSKFKSDFRYVAEYFVQTRRAKEGLTPKFELTLDHIKHMHEFMDLMNSMTKSEKFSNLPYVIAERGAGTMMTYLFDEAEARGIDIGRSQGIGMGIDIGAGMFAQLTNNLLSLGKYDELAKASTDVKYRDELYTKYGIEMPKNSLD